MKVVRMLVLSVCGFGLVACGGGTKEKSFQVSASASPGGSVNIAQTMVAKGSTASFSFTSSTGYHLQTVTGCGGTLTGGTYVTGIIAAECTVIADFQRNTYALSVQASTGGGYAIHNSKPEYGDTSQVIAIPDSGYGVASFSGCGAGTTDYSVYTTAPITADCAVALSFKKVVAIQGSAAEGAALADAQVSAKCSDGSTFITKVTTDTAGKFIGQVGEQAFPCALSVTTAAPLKTYYSIATQAGTTNINLLTDMSLVLASGKSGADWYASSNWASVKTNLVNVQASLKDSLYNLGYILPAGDFLPFTATFQLGDAWDKLLDQIQVGVEKSPGMTYESLIGLLKSGDTSLVPAPTGGSEPTAEVCFNPVLYAEGTTLATRFINKVTYTNNENGSVFYEEQEDLNLATNGSIIIENGLPILTRSITTTHIQPNTPPSYSEGNSKLFVNLQEKVVGLILFSGKAIDPSNGLGGYFFNYNYIGTYSSTGFTIDYKLAKNVSFYEEYDYKFIFFVSGQNDSGSKAIVNNIRTFKGLTKVTRLGSDYRVCDFEIQSKVTNQISLSGDTTYDDSSSTYHEYNMVGSGVELSERTTSIVLNGQELLNGQPN